MCAAQALTPGEREELHDAPQPRAVRGPGHDEQRLAAREEDGQAGERLLDVALVDARLVLCGVSVAYDFSASREACV